jgi:hypothetical protein
VFVVVDVMFLSTQSNFWTVSCFSRSKKSEKFNEGEQLKTEARRKAVADLLSTNTSLYNKVDQFLRLIDNQVHEVASSTALKGMTKVRPQKKKLLVSSHPTDPNFNPRPYKFFGLKNIRIRQQIDVNELK